MKLLLGIFISLITLSCVCSYPFADSGAEYTIIKATTPPKIDGKLDDVIWKFVEPAKIGLKNAFGVKATKESLAYAVYDDKAIYVAFHRLDKDVKSIKATVGNRDGNVWEDDEFELFLDVDHDHVTYWQICLNSLNTIWDCYNSGAGCNGGDNLNWETATSVGATQDWFAEIKVTLSELGVKTPPKVGDVWGVNFAGHVISGVIDEWVTWSDIGPSFHVPKGFGNMIFSNKKALVSSSGKLPSLWAEIKSQ